MTTQQLSLWTNDDEPVPNGEQVVHRCNEDELHLTEYQEAEYRRARFDAQQDTPILGEYCWMHDGPGNGGWSCAACYEAQRD